ncbi:phage tail protein [Micromonospora polyrhachis]|uniref:Phage tail-like protein n=1 Tax=Micromonospora polyrhachis TaxID=1282883 RepID=A0A7W7WT91_9ACTN|nr:phage tail protein [Micromonospora polyrhachis]MBB4962447.1 phage tail-like protein [Micromonospora polyrhachis]
MRAAVPGLASPFPIGMALPALYLDDDFTQRFTAGLDEVLAPVLLTLDCLDAYLDLELAPPDFLDLLASWVAAPTDGTWPVALRRELVRHAVELHRWRGTARGIAREMEILTGGTVEVDDSGAVTWSSTPNTPAPPATPAEVRVRIRVPDPASVDQPRLQHLLASSVPAHVSAIVEVEAA